MIITQQFNFRLRQMLIPFLKWLDEVKEYEIVIHYEKNRDLLLEIDVEFFFYDKDNKHIDFPYNEEINSICKMYYNETDLVGLVYNQLLEPIIDNMKAFELSEIREKF